MRADYPVNIHRGEGVLFIPPLGSDPKALKGLILDMPGHCLLKDLYVIRCPVAKGKVGYSKDLRDPLLYQILSGVRGERQNNPPPLVFSVINPGPLCRIPEIIEQFVDKHRPVFALKRYLLVVSDDMSHALNLLPSLQCTVYPL